MSDTVSNEELAQPSFIGRPASMGLNPEAKKARIREILALYNCFGLDFSGEWLEKVLLAYQQPHRFFHTLDHLLSICEGIARREEDREMAAKLLLVGLFHDVVWYPQGGDSEEKSVEVFDYLADSLGSSMTEELRRIVRQAILATKHQSAEGEVSSRFHEYDCQIIIEGDPVDLLGYEFQIFREFQYLNMVDYRKGRSAFFERFARRYPKCRQTMRFLVEYLERRRPRVGIYAGTFQPFHIGHLSILEKAELMFDKVIVAVGVNPEKHVKRDGQIDNALPFHEVLYFDTLMVDLIDQESVYSDVTLVRGLRNGYDLDYEMNQLCFMQEMRPNTHAIYIPCDKQLEHVSSSALNSLKIFKVNGRDNMYYPVKYDYYRKSIEELFGPSGSPL